MEVRLQISLAQLAQSAIRGLGKDKLLYISKFERVGRKYLLVMGEKITQQRESGGRIADDDVSGTLWNM